jgi:two-component system response regulator FlrC
MERVLVVDDEPGIRSFIRQVLEGEGLEVSEAPDGDRAAELIDRQSFHLLITDLRMPGMDGMQLLERARASMPEMETIVLTAHGTVESAVQAMKLGAFDYLTKPLSGPAELRLIVERALERRRLRHRAAQAGEAEGGPPLIAVDPAMRAVVEQVDKVAPTGASVLLLGESGTGKEIVARAIHARSPRASGPFVAVNCAAVSPQLIESEVFGHEKGAFTGATARRAGRFELADGGTLFLDEVAELPAELQAKLLRVLQERRFERLGGTREITVDVRLVAATNRDLEREMGDGRFREDLYHRLAVFPIRLPPLRERSEDVVPLARHILERLAGELGRPGLQLTSEAEAALLAHGWPGNVRELGNALERAAILAPGGSIEATQLGLDVLSEGGRGAQRDEQDLPGGTLKAVEREAIRRALEATGHHRKRAAERLGIGLRTLYDKLKAYGLD